MAFLGQKPRLGARINTGHPLANGLGACWTFSEAGGYGKIADIAGAHQGTMSNFTAWGLGGPYGTALNFNQTNTVVNCGTSDDILLNTNPVTYAVAFYPRSIGATSGRVITKEAVGVSGMAIAMVATATFQFQISGSTPLIRKAANSTLTFNTWNYIHVTHDGSTTAANCHIYLNGVEVGYATTTNGASLASTSGKSILIGNRDDNLRSFDGYISMIKVWKRILTTDEIMSDYLDPYAVINVPFRRKLNNITAAIARIRRLTLLGVGQ